MTGEKQFDMLDGAAVNGRSILSFVSYHTSQYKLHYYETPTNIKFVMLTDLKSPSMRIALQQIYINLFVEYGGWPRDDGVGGYD